MTKSDFSKLDLTQAYLQVEVSKVARESFTINTHRELFQFTRLHFRVKKACYILEDQGYNVNRATCCNCLHSRYYNFVYIEKLLVLLTINKIPGFNI